MLRIIPTNPATNQWQRKPQQDLPRGESFDDVLKNMTKFVEFITQPAEKKK